MFRPRNALGLVSRGNSMLGMKVIHHMSWYPLKSSNSSDVYQQFGSFLPLAEDTVLPDSLHRQDQHFQEAELIHVFRELFKENRDSSS